MAEKSHLHVLWTTGTPITAEKMVLMHAANAFAHGWWEKVTLILGQTPDRDPEKR
jgi:hypothetical protein